MRNENTASSYAQQLVVTLPVASAMEARRHLQLWKHIADNRDFQESDARIIKGMQERHKIGAKVRGRDKATPISSLLVPHWVDVVPCNVPTAEVAQPPHNAIVDRHDIELAPGARAPMTPAMTVNGQDMPPAPLSPRSLASGGRSFPNARLPLANGGSDVGDRTRDSKSESGRAVFCPE
jgi:hypothetical protein